MLMTLLEKLWIVFYSSTALALFGGIANYVVRYYTGMAHLPPVVEIVACQGITFVFYAFLVWCVVDRQSKLFMMGHGRRSTDKIHNHKVS